MPYPSLLHPEPLSLWQSTTNPYLHRRCSNTILSQSLWGLWVLGGTQGLFEPSEHVWWEWGLILNMNSSLLPSCWGISFAIGHAVSPQSHSSAYCLTAVSLTLDVGYLFLASRCSRAVQPPAAAGIGEFNLGDRYIYYCWQESIRRKGVAIIVNERVQNAVLGCSPKTTE